MTSDHQAHQERGLHWSPIVRRLPPRITANMGFGIHGDAFASRLGSPSFVIALVRHPTCPYEGHPEPRVAVGCGLVWGKQGDGSTSGLCLVGGGEGRQGGFLVRSLVDGAGSYSVAHRAGLLPTELTGMWGWILLRFPHRGRGHPQPAFPLSKGLVHICVP